MLTKIKNRIKSNRGDGNSVSHILWIALVIALIYPVCQPMCRAMRKSGYKSAARLQNSECYLREGRGCTMTKRPNGGIGIDYRFEELDPRHLVDPD